MKLKAIFLGLFLAFFCPLQGFYGADSSRTPPGKETSYRVVYVRLTCYSGKQPREGYKTASGKSARNEKGVAVPKGFLPLGTRVVLPDGQMRVVDDHTSRWAGRKFKGKLVDVRYYQSLKSKPETKAVNRELMRRFDMGYGKVKVIQ